MSSQAQRDQVCDNHLAEGDEAATADALDGPADEHVGEVVRHGGDDRPDEEEDERGED